MTSGTLGRCCNAIAASIVWLLVASAGMAQTSRSVTRITGQAEWDVFSKQLVPPWRKPGMSAVVGPNGVTFSMAPTKWSGP